MSQQSTSHRNGLATTHESKTFKQTVAEYLNDTDLVHAKHQFVTYLTVILILASITVLILETVTELDPRFHAALKLIDGIIMFIFTAEYLLRIWAASVDGWQGSWKYVRSFYGVMDLIAIFPFYLNLMAPATDLSFLRITRLLRILLLGRYFKSFQLIKRAVIDKKGEIAVALQVVVILTVLLSVVMYEIEHNQPKTYFKDIPTTIGWSISKFVRDVGGAETGKPETIEGRVVATLIGLLAIALFALPAGIVASGFVHEIEEDKKRKKLEDKRARLVEAFREIHNEWLGMKAPRKYITMVQAKSRLNLLEDDIIAIAELNEGIRLRYKCVNTQDSYPSALVIEQFAKHRTYGTLEKNHDSDIVVICPTSYDETSIGHFSLCLARLLGATYISNEVFGEEDGVDPKVACSFSENRFFGYMRHELEKKDDRHEEDRPPGALKEFLSDIYHYTTEGKLVFIVKTMGDNKHREVIGSDEPFYRMPRYPAMHYNELMTFSNALQVSSRKGSSGNSIEAHLHGTSANDLHAHIEKNTHATVITLTVGADLLEWSSFEEYYGAIREIADQIRNRRNGTNRQRTFETVTETDLLTRP